MFMYTRDVGRCACGPPRLKSERFFLPEARFFHWNTGLANLNDMQQLSVGVEGRDWLGVA